jgi:hypothetical protein
MTGDDWVSFDCRGGWHELCDELEPCGLGCHTRCGCYCHGFGD